MQLAANSTKGKLWIGLDSVYRQVNPGDQIVVQVVGVTSSEIAIEDPNGLRGFAPNVAVKGPMGKSTDRSRSRTRSIRTHNPPG